MGKWAPMIVNSEYTKTNLGITTPSAGGYYRHVPVSEPSKVLLRGERNSNSSLMLQFNPTALNLAGDAKYGALEPVGWPSDFEQYSSTKTPPFELTFPLSSIAAVSADRPWQLIPSGDYEETDIRGPITWLQGFLYGKSAGVAPDRMIVSWPGTVLVTCFVHNVKVDYTMWYNNGIPSKANVTLTLKPAQMNTFEEHLPGSRRNPF